MKKKVKKFSVINGNNENNNEPQNNNIDNYNDNNLLNNDYNEIYNQYKYEYLNKNIDERLTLIQEELLKTLIYVDMQLKEIEIKTEGKQFTRSVYEQKNNLINLRIKILEKLSDMQLKEKEENENEYSDITEILSS